MTQAWHLHSTKFAYFPYWIYFIAKNIANYNFSNKPQHFSGIANYSSKIAIRSNALTLLSIQLHCVHWSKMYKKKKLPPPKIGSFSNFLILGFRRTVVGLMASDIVDSLLTSTLSFNPIASVCIDDWKFILVLYQPTKCITWYYSFHT